jgi:hypothetical protein
MRPPIGPDIRIDHSALVHTIREHSDRRRKRRRGMKREAAAGGIELQGHYYPQERLRMRFFLSTVVRSQQT